MPRVSSSSIDEEVVVPKKRAPRKRAPKAAAVTDDAAAPRPRARRAPRASAPTDEQEEAYRAEPTVAAARRAPTPLRAERRQAVRSSRFLVGLCIFVLSAFGAAVGIGLTDRGQIDVVAIVNERNEKVNRGEVRDASGQPITTTIPVQNTDARPNGGLVAAEPSVTPPREVAPAGEETATTSASSSDVAAQPTDDETSVPDVDESN